MKKNFRYCSSVIALGTLMFFAGCSNSTKPQDGKGGTETVKVDSLPSQPKDQQKYVDSNGNQWVYNAILMHWALSGSGGNSYYYYPSTGTYTDQNKNTVTPPATVSSGISNGVKARTEPVTVTRSTSNSSSVKSSTSKSTTRKSVFGSSARSKSVGA